MCEGDRDMNEAVELADNQSEIVKQMRSFDPKLILQVSQNEDGKLMLEPCPDQEAMQKKFEAAREHCRKKMAECSPEFLAKLDAMP